MNRTLPTGLFVLLAALPTAVLAQDVVVLPQITGSLEALQPLPVIDSVQSTCHTVPPRRGFAEFIVPSLPGHVREATLVLTETRGTVSFPMPPNTHELSWYEGDLVLVGSDFDAPTTLLTTFQTDANDPTRTFRFDVTKIFRLGRRGGQDFAGHILGFRVRLAQESGAACDVDGSEFGSLSTIPPRIEIRLGPGGKN